MKKLPLTLLLALGLEIVATMVFAVWFVEHPIGGDSVRVNMAFDAAIVVSAVRHRGIARARAAHDRRESLGLRIAAGGYAVALAIMAFWQGVVNFQPQWGSDTYDVIGRWPGSRRTSCRSSASRSLARSATARRRSRESSAARRRAGAAARARHVRLARQLEGRDRAAADAARRCDPRDPRARGKPPMVKRLAPPKRRRLDCARSRLRCGCA